MELLKIEKPNYMMTKSPVLYRVCFFITVCFMILTACESYPTSQERNQSASLLARQADWLPIEITTNQFTLQSYIKKRFLQGDELSIYIEGDGFSWVSRTKPSLDPTPLIPTGLKLALAQPIGNVAYLARPCQYNLDGNKKCNQFYWTHGRFSSEVIDAMNQAIDQLKNRYNANSINLIGYSGGGAVAMLVAKKRNDVEKIITVAGNLNHRAWSSYHGISPLKGSLNAFDIIHILKNIPQVHFVGDADKVIPPVLFLGFSGVKIINGYDHHCCWVKNWPNHWLNANDLAGTSD